MKKSSVTTFFWLGTCLRYLQDISPVHLVRTKDGGGALDNIDRLCKSLDKLDLVVTKRVATYKLDGIRNELAPAAEGVKLTVEQAKKIRDACKQIRVTLDAEIAGMFVYVTTQKILDVDKLLDKVADLFSPGIYDALPDIAKHDFAEAGKCIAFERPTAAAFHILRATEAVLRFYYESMIRNARIQSRMWGPIVVELRKRPKTKSYEVLNNHLDNIRESFRNPTQHPEAVYDIYEVQDLWALCIDVTNRMIKVLKDNQRI